MSDFRTTISTDSSPAEVLAIISDVRSWWVGEITGDARAVGDVFTYQVKDIHRSTQRVVELVPSTRVVWEVTDAALSFAQDPTEWIGTRIVFDLAEEGSGTRVTFTHEGLTPELDCFAACSGGWTHFIGTSLDSVLAGGQPAAMS